MLQPCAHKEQSLPISVTWNGKGGIDFEKYLDKITGHVVQQAHMGYLLLDQISLLWLKYGDARIVLTIAIQDGLHASLPHISPSQFMLDV